MQDFFLSKQFGVAFNLNFKLHYLHSSSCTVLLNQKLFVQKSKTPFKNMKLVCCFTSSTLLNEFCLSVYSITETIDETLHAIYFEELYYKTRRKSNQKLVRSTINCPTMLATSGGTTGDVVADLIASSSVHLFLESQYDVI